MVKDDLANLRLDLAPKLNRPLSLWNLFDYLRLLFWVFYFPQALRWYVDWFGGGYIPASQMNWRKGLEILRTNRVQRHLFLQGLLLTTTIPPLIAWLLEQLGVSIAWVGVVFGVAYGVAVGVAGGVAFGVALGVAVGVALGVGLSVAYGVVARRAVSVAGRVAFGVAFGGTFGGTFGVALDMARGVALDVARGVAFGVAGGVAGSVAGGVAIVRMDSWLLAILLKPMMTKRYLPTAGSATILSIPFITQLVQKNLAQDWNTAVHNINELWAYTNQSTSVLKILNQALAHLPNGLVLPRLAQLAQAPFDWDLIKYTSAPLEFVDPSLRLDTPPRAAAAGFWYLHEEKSAKAAQAFAVVRDIRHGEEMHGLASLLALFDAAETAEQIAAIDLPDLPADRTLRPQTWAAINRFCNVVADTKTAQASASRTARAFATNRALGELQYIIDHPADLPEAERSLVIEIAKIWQSALLNITAAVGELNLTQPVQNPYVIGDPVEGDLFVGRDDIMRQLQELWLMGNHLQSVVIYGHRRMGKTSILKNIEPRLGSGIHVAYVNLLKSAGAETLSDVLLAISDQVAATLTIAPPSDAEMEASPDRTFDRFLRRATDTLTEGKGLIIALDEFEKIEELIEAGRLEASFLAYLRGLVQDSPRVGFAFAGLHTLEEMSADYFQPFFASVIPIKVDFFKRATVQTLLPNPGGDFPLDYDYDALDRIWELAAGQPYLTQLIGFQLVRRYNDQVFEQQQKREAKFTVADVQAVIDQPEFFAQGKPYFAGVWAQANHDAPGQQAILKALATHPDGLELDDLHAAVGLDSATFAAALATLQNHDVVRLNDGNAQIIVEVFRRWVSDRLNPLQQF